MSCMDQVRERERKLREGKASYASDFVTISCPPTLPLETAQLREEALASKLPAMPTPSTTCQPIDGSEV